MQLCFWSDLQEHSTRFYLVLAEEEKDVFDESWVKLIEEEEALISVIRGRKKRCKGEN